MSATIHPTNIQQIGNELAIAWSDGTESYYALDILRRACPCAACGGEPDVMGHVIRPDVIYSEDSFKLRGYQMVGGYALQPLWGDGHSSGLYAFRFLRHIAEASSSPST